VRINSKPSRLLALTTLGLAASLLASGLALAQSGAQQPQQFGPRAGKAPQAGQPGQAPKVDVVATHGQWKVQCETGNATGADGTPSEQRSCGMVQSTQSEKNPKATLTLVLVKTKAAEKTQINMRVIAPIGVFLPTGVALEIDGNAVGRVPFTRCMPQVCMAFAEASPDTLGKLKKGNEANFIIYEAPGIGLPMKLSLEGFSAALGELDKN
jgi:invasion protein IalB